MQEIIQATGAFKQDLYVYNTAHITRADYKIDFCSYTQKDIVKVDQLLNIRIN